MNATARPTLATRLAELVMTQLDPCDLGDGIEVVHDVEALEIEMECDVNDPAPVEPMPVEAAPVDDIASTFPFARQPADDVAATLTFARVDDVGTHEFVRFSAPYERIEIQIDRNAFLRATIEEARRRG
ncbi:MAG TPA: hypothetical protein VFV99_33880 [Kofleriaceae bacterium]|nr:hypothetical protein [Kofleriaceae bacterium]